VRAAVITAYQTPPEVSQRPEPVAASAQSIVELRAASLNPADLAVASGTFPFGSPPLPYVPGIEGVGTIVESSRFAPGTRVWACGRGLGTASDGAFSERFAAADEALVEVPADADDATAVAMGTAGLAGWLPLAWAAPVRTDETVLVLGATGSAGTVAVQAAKVLGAGRVVAAGRDAGKLELMRESVDEVVQIDDDFREHLVAATADAPPTLVIDLLWGSPVEAALAVAGAHARVVHVGQAAGPTATIASGLVRGKQLQIIGYSNFAVPLEALAEGYATLLGHAMADRIRLAVEKVSLESVTDAWQRQADAPHAKLVVVP
jgi:NADPH2:quinone reductase